MKKQVTPEQALLLIDMAVKMSDDGRAGKRRALWYLRRMIPIVLPRWLKAQDPIQTWIPNDLITTGKLILNGRLSDEPSPRTPEGFAAPLFAVDRDPTCEEIAAMDDDDCPCCEEGGE